MSTLGLSILSLLPYRIYLPYLPFLYRTGYGAIAGAVNFPFVFGMPAEKAPTYCVLRQTDYEMALAG